MKTWQKVLTGLAVGFTAIAVLVLPQVSLADDYGLGATAGAAGIKTDKSIQMIIGNVIGTALSMISVLFFALMLYAGIKWMLARGDSDEARKALDTIIAAIIGMLVVLGSYAITNFVFNSLGQGGGTAQNIPGGSSNPQLPQPQGSCKPKGGSSDICVIYDSDTCTLNSTDYCTYSGGSCQWLGSACSVLTEEVTCKTRPYCNWQ